MVNKTTQNLTSECTMNLSVARLNGKTDPVFFPLLAGNNLRKTKNDSISSAQPVRKGPDLNCFVAMSLAYPLQLGHFSIKAFG